MRFLISLLKKHKVFDNPQDIVMIFAINSENYCRFHDSVILILA